MPSAAVGQELHDLVADLFPITRSITGPGFRSTLDMLERTCGPMERHRFPTGQRVLDWVVPREWNIREAWIKDPSGRTVVTLEDSNLHVVSYSVPVHCRLPLADLQEHLHSLAGQPDAVPYRTSYYHEAWGFCLSERRRRALPDGEYEVLIDSELTPGRVELGEVTVPGQAGSEILFTTYCCHPSMANNELSGPVVVARLARMLRDRPAPPRHTYRFLFVPETIGAIAYLSRFGPRLRRRLAAGFVVTSVGSQAPFTYRDSRRGGSLADRVATHVLAHCERPYRVIDFYPPRSDERQYCSPGFNLPVGVLMRGGFDDWPEYHTSLDDLAFVTPGALAESFDVCAQIVQAIEDNETLAVTVEHGEPQLGRRGLYPALGGGWQDEPRRRQLEDMMFLLNFCDGSADLLAAAERSRRPLRALRGVADVLRAHDLLGPVAQPRSTNTMASTPVADSAIVRKPADS
jgi:aminopeptidase-like protein